MTQSQALKRLRRSHWIGLEVRVVHRGSGRRVPGSDLLRRYLTAN